MTSKQRQFDDKEANKEDEEKEEEDDAKRPRPVNWASDSIWQTWKLIRYIFVFLFKTIFARQRRPDCISLKLDELDEKKRKKKR